MARYHVVVQGEHAARLAHRYGFSDFRTIWDQPTNAELKKLRKNPNVLLPGDSVFIPDREERDEMCATDSKHAFRVKKPKLELCLTLESMYDRPLANASCALCLETDLREVSTDAKGKLEEPIPPETQTMTLLIRNGETPFVNEIISVRVGMLDPVESETGQRARLNNLGYYAGPASAIDGDMLRSAVEEFQCENGLVVDGACGPLTQAALLKIHGC